MKDLTKYRTNKTIKKRIDKILHKMAMIIADKDTGAKNDFGKRTKIELRKLEKKIKEIDSHFYDMICPY
jgi:phosphoglycerate-specific signal transduction histidine kinase|tara:strand:- start:434 stop:640 length:207 start_codon:yes stop_codon:yes gene_type:complete